MSGPPLSPIKIWTDGACEPNPGRGGWAALLIFERHEVSLSGGEVDTTNNRMEMTAAIKALEAIGYPATIMLYSDSQYLVRGVTEWMPKWIKRGQFPPEKNPDLWEQLRFWSDYHQIVWRWVRGHSGIARNEQVDAMAMAAIPHKLPPAAKPAAPCGAGDGRVAPSDGVSE